jgi:hypothetical protein
MTPQLVLQPAGEFLTALYHHSLIVEVHISVIALAAKEL